MKLKLIFDQFLLGQICLWCFCGIMSLIPCNFTCVGPQVRNAMASTSLSQTQLATIWLVSLKLMSVLNFLCFLPSHEWNRNFGCFFWGGGLHRNLADVDKDGKLKADEFILAMHLVDMAKEGQALPLALPSDFVPPSLRYSEKFVWSHHRMFIFSLLKEFRP